MSTEAGWPYDARQDDPLTALRIPVVSCPYPGANTAVFRKRGADDWCYRMASWRSGPDFVPGDSEPASLLGLLDRIHCYGEDQPISDWQEWKSARPGVFGGTDAHAVTGIYGEPR